jgi:hypothetical protein
MVWLDYGPKYPLLVKGSSQASDFHMWDMCW